MIDFITPTSEELADAKKSSSIFQKDMNDGPSLFSYGFAILLFIVGCITILIVPRIIHGYMFIGIAISIFFAKRYRFLEDIAYLTICTAKGWTYDPDNRYEKGNRVSAELTEIFGSGSSPYVEDQIWGPNFYIADFEHTVGSGKSRHQERHTVVGVNAQLPVEFRLSPQLLEILTGKQELQLESEEFNKMYQFSYKGTKGEMVQSLTKILTPAMQTELVDLGKSVSQLTVFFRYDAIYFVMPKSFFSPRLSSLLSLKIDNADMFAAEQKVLRFVEFASRISELAKK